MHHRVQLIPKTRKGKTVCFNRGFLWDLDMAAMASVTPSDGRLLMDACSFGAKIAKNVVGSIRRTIQILTYHFQRSCVE